MNSKDLGNAANAASAPSLLFDVKQINNNIAAMREVMQNTMTEGVHYSRSSGSLKPALLKPGSELLLSMFGIRVVPRVTTSRDGEHTIFIVECDGILKSTGETVGTGVGASSTGEESAAWRDAIGGEFEEAGPLRARTKWKRLATGQEVVSPQVRTTPADALNSALKMAKKRAQVDMTLTALSCSELFTQDIGDQDHSGTASEVPDVPTAPAYNVAKRAPASKSKKPSKVAAVTNRHLTKSQANTVRSHLSDTDKDAIALCKHFGVDAIEGLTFSQFSDVLDWIAK